MSERTLNLIFAVGVLLLFAVVALVTWAGCVPACGGYEAAGADLAAEQIRAAASVDAGVPERVGASGSVGFTVLLD